MPTRILPCRLTDAELLDRGNALATWRGVRNERDADRAAEAKRLRALVDEADEEIDRLAAIIRDRAEPRSVECRSELHGYEVVTVRLDTGEEVKRRAATDADRQAELFEAAEPVAPSRAGKRKAVEEEAR